MLHQGLWHSCMSRFCSHTATHFPQHTYTLQGWWSCSNSEEKTKLEITLVRLSNFNRGSTPIVLRPGDLGLQRWRVSPPNSSLYNRMNHRTHRCILRVSSCCVALLGGSSTASLPTHFCQCQTWNSRIVFHDDRVHQWHRWTCRLLSTY